jgi:uroporphyrinogen-III synthase
MFGGNHGACRDNLTVTRMSFAGLKVIAFESRRAAEMAQLIRKQEGEPIVAPSMREAPIERNEEAFRFAERLFAGEFDMMILLTGVGTRILNQTLGTRYPAGRFAESLRRIAVVARGSKPAAVLRELNVPVTVMVPEPNTWREVLASTVGRPERRIAVQEYGRPSAELIAGLRARGAEVTSVRVYQWDLPEDTGPLREAAERIAAEEVDVALFTTSVQIDHLLRVAAEKGLEDYVRAAFSKMLVASVGPATTEALEDNGIHPDFEPSHPKMGFLVQETAERAEALLQAKR